jgi:hypothetical protein
MGNLYFQLLSEYLTFVAIPQKNVTDTAPSPSRSLRHGLCFLAETVFSLIPTHLPHVLRSPRVLIAIGTTVATAIGVVSYLLTRKKPSAEEIERERRELLARVGRITDGTIMDTMVAEVRKPALDLADDPEPARQGPLTPEMIVYVYRIAGVTYECAQDVTMLPELVHGVRTDLPIQVRYAPQNPANSIIVAETWSGLRLGARSPVPYPIQEEGELGQPF